MSRLQKRLAQPKKVDPRLIKPRRDHTLLAVTVDDELLPFILHALVTKNLTLVRAMNYARTLYNQFFKVPLFELMDIFAPVKYDAIETLEYFGSLDPSSFRLYTYWFSRFLFHVVMFRYHIKYKKILDLDLIVLKVYLFSEARRGLKPGTIMGILSAIRHMLYPWRKELSWLWDDKLMFEKFSTTLKKQYGRPRKKKIQLTFYLLSKIVVKIDFEDVVSLRDWILMVFTHIGSFRGGEVSPARWDDVEIDSYEDKFTGKKMNIFMLFMDSTKVSDQGDGAVVTISCPNEHSTFNLLSLMQQYITLLERGGFLNDYIFPSLRPQDRGLNKHITTATIRQSNKRLYKSIGGNPDEIGAHSGRGGMVEDAIAAGIPEELVKRHGRWRSACWRTYIHDEQWAMAATTSQLNEFQKKFANEKTNMKDKELLLAMTKNS